MSRLDKLTDQPCNQDGPNILLTEGKNDCHVILALCKFYDLPKNFGINDCGSDEKALKKFNALLNKEETEIIGIVIDADNPHLSAKWDAVKHTLTQRGIHLIPDKPNAHGTIIPASATSPRIGIWLMPDNQANGMLEDFCQQLVNPDAIKYAENCVDQALDNKFSTFKPVHKAKAVIHSFLSWQDEPGMPLGQAITARTLNPEHPLAQTFANWLVKLFQSSHAVTNKT